MSSMIELKKGCKIVNEFILFLMHKGYTNLKIDMYHKDKSYYYIIKTNKIEDKLFKYIRDNIDVERQFDLEEYTWELMGEGDGNDPLYLIGCFLDELELENTADETIFRMIRHVKY